MGLSNLALTKNGDIALRFPSFRTLNNEILNLKPNIPEAWSGIEAHACWVAMKAEECKAIRSLVEDVGWKLMDSGFPKP